MEIKLTVENFESVTNTEVFLLSPMLILYSCYISLENGRSLLYDSKNALS